MPIIYFFYGLSFGGLGMAAFLQFRRGSALPLRRQLPWLAAFGLAYAGVGWIDMFAESGMSAEVMQVLQMLRMILQPLSGLLMLRFGWGILTQMTPLPEWTRIIPGIIVVPLAFVVTYAATTFVTPSPIGIPIDIWSRYLLYLPGSIMAGIGFLRQCDENRANGLTDVGRLMFGAGLAFLVEAVMVGLIVPAAPYGPVSYYNYDRVQVDMNPAPQTVSDAPFTMIAWLDYDRVLAVTGLPIQFWRMLSAIAVQFFVVRGLDVFDAVEMRRVQELRAERDRAQSMARHVAESWTEALVRISQHIAELDELDSILQAIVHHTRGLLNSDYAAIALLENDGRDLILRCHAMGSSSEILAQRGVRVVIDNPLLNETLQAQRPFCSDDTFAPSDLIGLCFSMEHAPGAAIVVPLVLDSYLLGGLWCVRFERVAYSPTDMLGLQRLADQAVIAVQHSLMAVHLQSLAVLDERARIAREMHDGLAQILGYMNLQVQTLEALLKQDKRDTLFSELRQMRSAVQTAHADVRENILSLRTTLSTEAGVVSAIQDYVDGFSVQAGIEVSFSNHAGDELGLSPLAEVQLVCILQEALANVRKHAGAANVFVTLVRAEDSALLEIVDDGIGFIQPVARDRFGLHTMRERAESVGGELAVTSQLGSGTRIVCRLPVVQRQQRGELAGKPQDDVSEPGMGLPAMNVG